MALRGTTLVVVMLAPAGIIGPPKIAAEAIASRVKASPTLGQPRRRL
jgi:hypothetical protein